VEAEALRSDQQDAVKRHDRRVAVLDEERVEG
jgi:hypothetical protein